MSVHLTGATKHIFRRRHMAGQSACDIPGLMSIVRRCSNNADKNRQLYSSVWPMARRAPYDDIEIDFAVRLLLTP